MENLGELCASDTVFTGVKASSGVDGFSEMDDIIQTVKLEVTLDCEQGSSLSKMWSYAELAQRRLLQQHGLDSESATIDGALKRYLWPYILKLSEMMFINAGSTIHDTSANAVASDAARDFLALSADEAESRFPGLIMRASCKAINKEIFGREEGNEKLLRSVNCYKLIQELSRAREKGVTQVQLSKTLELDPRSTFHFLKTVDREGLLSKSVTFDSGNTTNLWVLRRFTTDRQGAADKATAGGSSNELASIPDENSPQLTAFLVGNGLRRRASDILEAAAPKFMPETDLMDALKLDLWNTRHRKYFHRVIRDLSEGGCVEKAQLQLPDADLSGFRRDMYQPAAEPMDVDESGAGGEPANNVPSEDVPLAESLVVEASESAGTKKGEGKKQAKQLAKPKKTRLENQETRLKKGRAERGLAEGHSYRRCVRFIKPYIDKGSVRARVGVPLEQSAGERLAGAASSTLDDRDAVMADADDAGNDGYVDSSSDEEDLDVDTLKDKDDILYVMSKHSVQVGALAMLPPEAQVFRLIVLSGSHGIVARAIQFILKWSSLKPLYRCLTHLEQTPVFLPDGSWPGVYTLAEDKRENREHMDERLITSIDEFMGRERRKRYFVNPMARMAIKSLTVCSGIVAVQQPTPVPDPTLLATSQAASDSVATAAGASSSDRDGSTARSPLLQEQVSLAGPSESRPPAPPVVPEPTVAVALTTEEELVLADLVKAISMDDISAESRERKIPLSSTIREYVILGMLKQESVFACNTEQAIRCDKLVKSYALANMDSPMMSATLSNSLLNYSMDKRTFQRLVVSLADQNRLWFQDVYSLPEVARANAPSKVQVAIARDTDPDGTIVHTYLAQMRDTRRLNKQNGMTAIRRIAQPVPVARTEGAEERDRDFLLRKMDTNESRAQGIKNFSLKHPIGRKYGDAVTTKRPNDPIEFNIIKRARVSLLENTAKAGPLQDWDIVVKRLNHIPRRIGRAKNLYEYLLKNLADDIDDQYVYKNYAFRSSFLFYRLPLELFLQVTGGISYFRELLPFVRYGICSPVGDRACGSAETSAADIPGSEASSLESMNQRLATPINLLPAAISEVIEKKAYKTRLHFQTLIYALYILQLLRPVDTAREIVDMPPPPSAKDAFSSVSVMSPKILGFGFQLIGKARLLNESGYNLALDAYSSMTKQRLDFTACYLGSQHYDMMDADDQFKYWSDLQASAMVEAKNLTSKHILFGIGRAYYWTLNVSLDGRQTKILHSYVNQAEFSTPLDDPDLLAKAAKRAGTTLEEARRYYLHQQSQMARRSSRTKAYQESRQRYVKYRIERAKMIEAGRRQQADENDDAGSDSGNVRKQRIRWTEPDSIRVAVCYAVMKHHAYMYNHMFVLLNIGEFFPNRTHNLDPSDNARHHWQKMQQKAAQRVKCAKIHHVWRYVFRDAIEQGDLQDNEDLNSFDLKGAINYYYAMIQREGLDNLVSRYAKDLDDDNVVFEAIEPSGVPARSKPVVIAPKPAEVSNEPEESEASDASIMSETEDRHIHRLPATLKGKEAKYRIKVAVRTRAVGTRGFEFTEDSMRENASVRFREQHSASAMLTTHRGWECATDHINPSTILLPIRSTGANSSRMDVDGEIAVQTTKGEPLVAVRGTDYVPYTDPMGRRRHVKRKFDVSVLARRISELALGGDSDLEKNQTPKAEIGDSNRSRLYAELASMQAMIVNLAITPADEYDVETGHRLLGAKKSSANDAFRRAKSNNSLVRLSNMVASSGLGVQPAATAPMDSAEPADDLQIPAGAEGGALASLANALKSATVAYETTGMMRIATKPGSARSLAHRSGTNEADASTSEDSDADDDPDAQEAMSHGDRKVPGRGFAASEKFMNAIRPTHADRFAHPRDIIGSTDSMLNGHLGVTAFERLCWLVGQGKLWLRPEYGGDMLAALQSGMSGFKNQNDNDDPPDFAVKAAYVDCMADTETRGDPLGDAYRRSTSESVPKALLPVGDSLAVVSRVMAGFIHEMGAMGASEHELFALLAALSRLDAFTKSLAALPDNMRSILSTRPQLSALLRLLALEGRVRVVGSNDIRYVSDDAYRKHWSLTLEGIERAFEPYLGQNTSGSVNTTYTLGMLTSLVSHIIDNPGIPQFMLMRRFFAPIVPKKEVMSYLGLLVDMGLVVAENIQSDVLLVKGQAWSVAGSTHYSMAPDYRHRIAQLLVTDVARHLNKV
ncbi:hypothetical protein IW152_004049 [Coemansia sp. BCRC 34962]|nr:hypothetical protein IW152_004049 [Coemansia sp. BCRC 34962]